MKDRQSTRRRFLAAAGSAVLVAASGCASASDEPRDDAAWKDIDEWYFEGRIEGWTGIQPAIIADEENPTIVLFEGETYDFRWVNEDGAIHNIELWDDAGDIVDEYEGDDLDRKGEEEVLANVVATPAMTRYVCRYHQTTQVGDIEVRRP